MFAHIQIMCVSRGVSDWLNVRACVRACYNMSLLAGGRRRAIVPHAERGAAPPGPGGRDAQPALIGRQGFFN